MELKVKIDSSLCKKCKVCTEICPVVIFHTVEELVTTRPERMDLCIACGQCMAACAEKAIQVDGLSYERDFFEFSETIDAFQSLVETRRSVRAFSNKPILREDLEKIVHAVSYSPPSFPPLKVELVVVNDRKFIRQTLPLMVGFYDKLVEGLKKPIPRYFIRKSVGEKKYRVVKNHLLPLLSAKLLFMKNGREDAIYRNAHAAIVFHADKEAENYIEDSYIALAFGLLKAHSLGIGACAVELIPPAINKIPELKEMFGIPSENEAVISMVLGYPKYKYRRGIKRNLKSVRWIGD